MSSNYPPGVTGNEPQIAGDVAFEGALYRCPNCDLEQEVEGDDICVGCGAVVDETVLQEQVEARDEPDEDWGSDR
jgi:hypothetical protein